MKVLRKILFIIFLSFSVLILSGLGYYFAVTKDTKLQPQKLLLDEKNIVIYDENGEIASVATGIKQTVPLSEIPQKTRQAFIDTEDKRFFTHNGFDFRRIVKATLTNLKAGSFKQGASTISQQLIKNTHLSQEKTVKRKLKEWKLTRELERNYSKEEILEKYLNIIYFGHNCFGINSASEFYFGKKPSELTLADSAILAGLVKSPNNYSPFKNPENCQKRKERVLKGMLTSGSITENELQTALAVALPQTPSVNTKEIGYAHFVFDELSAIAEKYDFTVGGKIEIYTYLDEPLQKKLIQTAENYKETDMMASVISNETHGISACISTVGDVKRTPASLLKPLLVYAPSIEENLLSPATPILDEKINYGGYSPENYDGQFHGYLSARECLAKSLNIPAVRILETLGVQKGAEYLTKLGLPVEEQDLSLALALGGMQNGYTLPKLLSAYSVLQNGGQFYESGFIRSVKIDGIEVFNRTVTPAKVFSEDTAYLTTDMLKTAVQSGTAKKLRALPFPVACKTGTAGTDKGNTDAYALSYTTRNLVGVWFGNADNSYIDYTGGGAPCNFLFQIHEYLNAVYTSKGETIQDFSKPSTVTTVELDKTSYYDRHIILSADPKAPVEYTFSELFKNSCIPLKQSDSFTNPSISPPSLSLKENGVEITFQSSTPEYYSYKILRTNYNTHTTKMLYYGERIDYFLDDTIENGKTYQYSIVPIFQNNIGQKITLPTVTTSADELPLEKDKILEKDWWDY